MARTINFVEITETGNRVVVLVFGEDLGLYYGDACVEVLVDEQIGRMVKK